LEASNRVQTMFNDINSALFDHTKTGSKVLDHECDEWSNKYPHIRYVFIIMQLYHHHGNIVE